MLVPQTNGQGMSPTATIYILGSGCPTPTPDRYGTAFAIKTESDLVLVDCGPATTWKIAKAGLNPRDFSTLLLSHHHFDHNVDTPCFILTRWDQNKDSQNPLQVFGPQPTQDFCAKICGPEGAYFPDWHARCNWQQSLNVFQARGGTLPRRGPVVQATDIQPGWTYSTKTWKATAGYADHAQPFLNCVGYRFELPSGKTFVFSGDTGLCDEMVELARGADVFFCMSSGADMNESQSDMTHCAQGAANPRDAGIMAQRAGVKTLVLVHQGPGQALKENWSKSIDAAKATFSGEVIFGEELMTMEI